MTIDYRAIGAHLRALRKERALTRQEVIERTRIAMTHHTLSQIENGTRQPSLGHLHALAQAYGVYLEIGIGALSVEGRS